MTRLLESHQAILREFRTTKLRVRRSIINDPMVRIKSSAALALTPQERFQTFSRGSVQDEELKAMSLGGVHERGSQYQIAWEGQNSTALSRSFDSFADCAGQVSRLA